MYAKGKLAGSCVWFFVCGLFGHSKQVTNCVVTPLVLSSIITQVLRRYFLSCVVLHAVLAGSFDCCG